MAGNEHVWDRPPQVRPARRVRYGSAASRYRRRRRQRILLRRATALTLLLLAVVALVHGFSSSPASSSPATSLPAVAPPEIGAAPEPPGAGADMSVVWSAAVASDPSPGLAISGQTTTQKGRIALTFDDGPDPVVTPQVLDTLLAYDVEATFFVVGRYVAQHPEIVQRIVAEGHTLGNHTYTHPDMSFMNAAQMNRELRRTQRAVDRALGYEHQMFVMRPPFGHPYYGGADNLPVFERVMRRQQLFPVLWTPSPHDYLYDGQPGRIIQDVKRERAPGRDYDGVLLLHDTKQQSADALPGIIEHYLSEGLEFTGVHELLADKYLGG